MKPKSKKKKKNPLACRLLKRNRGVKGPEIEFREPVHTVTPVFSARVMSSSRMYEGFK